MSMKVIVFSAQVLLIKTILGQCIGNIGNPYGIGNCEGFVGNNYALLNPCGNAQITVPDHGIVGASYGGSLIVQASSPIAPGSISVQSENQIQGPVSVYGTLPFLSAVAFEGLLPTHGTGAVTYHCGDGSVAIIEENIDTSGYNSFAPLNIDERYNTFGAGWSSVRSGSNGIPSVYGQKGFNSNKGVQCSCGY